MSCLFDQNPTAILHDSQFEASLGFALVLQMCTTKSSLCNAGDQPRDLVHARQALYQLLYFFFFLLFLYYWKQIFFIYSDYGFLSPSSSKILPASPPVQIHTFLSCWKTNRLSVLLFFFLKGSPSIAQATLELSILLLQQTQVWGFRCVHQACKHASFSILDILRVFLFSF